MMPIPTWPVDVPTEPLRDSYANTPWAPAPIVTEMEGGNTRVRRRPGDDVSLVSQTVRMKTAQLSAFKAWFKDTIGGGAGRFSAPVWNGEGYVTKTCQFNLSQPLRYSEPAQGLTDVAMQLRVYE
jgi:hypothetical protein